MIILTNNDRMGKNILSLRQKKNLSLDSLARFVGMDAKDLNAIEQGTLLEIDARVLEELSREFQVKVSALVEESL